jgi:hypothetical protein
MNFARIVLIKKAVLETFVKVGLSMRWSDLLCHF